MDALPHAAGRRLTVSFRLREALCCASKLGRGEAKRVPRSALHPVVGYYVGCPLCGRPQTIPARHVDPEGGQDFVESDEGITMTPGHVCTRCSETFAVERGTFVHVV